MWNTWVPKSLWTQPSFALPKSPCFLTNVGQLKIDYRIVCWPIGISHPSLKKILDPPLQPFTLPLRVAQKPTRYHRSHVRREALSDLVFRLPKSYPLWCRHTLSQCLFSGVHQKELFLNNTGVKWQIRFFVSLFFQLAERESTSVSY